MIKRKSGKKYKINCFMTFGIITKSRDGNCHPTMTGLFGETYFFARTKICETSPVRGAHIYTPTPQSVHGLLGMAIVAGMVISLSRLGFSCGIGPVSVHSRRGVL